MYIWFDILYLVELIFVLVVTHGVAYLIGYTIRGIRAKRDKQKDCKHVDIVWMPEISTYMCRKCGTIFRNEDKV